MFHHQNLLQKIDMLNNIQQNFLRNAKLIKHWNRDMVDRDLFHLNLNYSFDNHRMLESKKIDLGDFHRSKLTRIRFIRNVNR
jgi:hypothetical protein